MKFLITELLNKQLNHLKKNCPADITDLVFLEIEKHHMLFYNLAVKNKGVEQINQFIGKTIREHWDLKNLGRCNTPKSKLITSYEKHSN